MSLYYINSINSISFYFREIALFPGVCEDLRVIVFGNALFFLSFIPSHSLFSCYFPRNGFISGVEGVLYLGMIYCFLFSLILFFYLYVSLGLAYFRGFLGYSMVVYGFGKVMDKNKMTLADGLVKVMYISIIFCCIYCCGWFVLF